jgi:hypothetical protein
MVLLPLIMVCIYSYVSRYFHWNYKLQARLDEAIIIFSVLIGVFQILKLNNAILIKTLLTIAYIPTMLYVLFIAEHTVVCACFGNCL